MTMKMALLLDFDHRNLDWSRETNRHHHGLSWFANNRWLGNIITIFGCRHTERRSFLFLLVILVGDARGMLVVSSISNKQNIITTISHHPYYDDA